MSDDVLPEVLPSVDEAVALGEQLVDAWACWSPNMTRNADRVAYISDRSGTPELKVAHGGKGVLKQAARRVIPSEVIDRPKGYFPVPALTHLEGGFLDRVRDALTAPAAKERGLFNPRAVERLLAAPNDALTPLGGNPLWQLALLEMWLQGHGL